MFSADGLAIAWSHARMGEVFVIAAVCALDAGLLAAAVVMLGRPQPAKQIEGQDPRLR